jgi:catechol 2,3-dioxygenase-like lactoylglutathione lyase family enzyme
MLHHVSVGVRDVERAAEFYDAVLGALGYKRVMEFLPHAVAYGDIAPEFWVQLPHNQQVATAGNGVHISFIARTKDAVDAFHAKAVELGAQDAGAPGPRPDYSPDYYGAFVFDIDGNKLEATLLPQSEPATKKVKRAVKKAKKATPAKKSAVAKKAAPVKKAAKKAAQPVAKKPIAKKAVKKAKPAPAKKKAAKKKVAKKGKKK